MQHFSAPALLLWITAIALNRFRTQGFSCQSPQVSRRCGCCAGRNEDTTYYHHDADQQELLKLERCINISRRNTIVSITSLGVLLSRANSVSANEKTSVIVKGVVSVPTDFNATVATTRSNPVLYITARPDRPDNVPAAILSGTRGKAPPVLVARYENPGFPFCFELSKEFLTVEGATAPDGSVKQDADNFWWKNSDLVLSARLDMDGIAATRSPEDLVGRALTRKNERDVANLKLTGRGSFGKFVTGGK